MKLIQSADNLIDLVMGKHKYDENIPYRPLNYLIYTETAENKTLVFNNLTKAMVLLEPDECNALKKNDFSNNIELKIKLAEMFFLVKNSFDEKKNVDSIRDISRSINATNAITSYTILPTTACNARCFYCYEAGIEFKTMNENTADAVSKFIIKNSKGKKVRIQWFGGEPLCNMSVIDIICSNLSDNNVIYKSTMTTNGYLFDDNVIPKAVNLWHLKGVQITLDGLADTYNKVKNYKNNDNNAFDRVVDNIIKLSDSGISVRIRLNMDYHNSTELYQLADYLHNRFGDRKNISLYVAPLFENVGYTKTIHNELEKEELIDSCIKLTEYFFKLGFPVRQYECLDRVQTFSCQADNPSMFIILPNGDLAFCEHYLENDSFGSVFDNEVKKPFWCDYRSPIADCATCPQYPTCLVLERCISGSVKCNRFTRYTRLKSIEFSMKKTYNKFMESNKDNIEPGN